MCVPGVSCGELELRLDKDDGGGWLLVYAARALSGSGRLTAHHAETLGSPEGGRSAAAIGTRRIITRPIQMYIYCTASPSLFRPFSLSTYFSHTSGRQLPLLSCFLSAPSSQ